MSDHAISFEDVNKSYGGTVAVQHLSLSIERGRVFGFLGPNGAGKTTTIRMLLDLIRPTSGSINVLGLDSRENSVEIHKRVGYVPGELSLPEKYTGKEFLAHMANIRGGVPAQTISELAGRLNAPIEKLLGDLSRGNKQKIGLIQALMHQPQLLILDEPTSGLDPLMQNEFLSIIRERAADGCTILLSSHLLHEVQEIATDVAIIREGILISVEDVQNLHQHSVRRVEITFESPVDSTMFRSIPGVSDVECIDNKLKCLISGADDPLVKEAARHQVRTYLAHEPDLEEVFLRLYNKDEDR